MTEGGRAFGLRRGDVEPEQVFVLGPGVHRVGARSGNEVVLDVPGVSRLHCELDVGPEGVRLTDLASKNGVTVNGAPHTRGLLELGDEIRLGEATLRLETARWEDLELGIHLSGLRGSTPSSGTRGPTREEVAERADPWQVVNRFAETLVGSSPGRVGQALEIVAEFWGLAGAAWLELGAGGRPVLLAVSGRVSPRSGLAVDRGEPSAIAVSEPGAESSWVEVGQPLPDGRCLGVLRLEGSTDDSDPEVLRVLARMLALAFADAVGGAGGVRAEGPPESEPGGDVGLVELPGHVVGGSDAARALEAELGRVAATEIPLLILGETGVGKEQIARRAHASSRRADKPFVAVNCAAIPEHLAEAELFGIGRGVATGVEERRGQFALAEGGTLLLDEVGELSPQVQIKLLRALQEREIRPLGRSPRSIDVRILAATNADLLAAVESGGFRADLYYRLAGAVLEVPALRQRRDDLPVLVESFVRRFGRESRRRIRGVTLEALDVLGRYPWPGNIRELENEVRRLVLRTPPGQPIRAGDLSAEIRRVVEAGSGGSSAGNEAQPFDLASLERRAIERALAETDGNQAQAARLLGISRFALRRRIEQHRD